MTRLVTGPVSCSEQGGAGGPGGDLEESGHRGAWWHGQAQGCPLRVLHVLTPPGGLCHVLLLLPDVHLQRALAVAAVPRVVDDRGVPGNTGHTQRVRQVPPGRRPRAPHEGLSPQTPSSKSSPKPWPMLPLNLTDEDSVQGKRNQVHKSKLPAPSTNGIVH